MPDLNPNDRPEDTAEFEQYILNHSYDHVFKLLMIGILAYNVDTNTYDRLQIDDATGGLKVTIVGGSSGGGGSSRPTDAYKLIRDDDYSDPTNYEYYGYEDSSANWYISRYDVVNHKSEFVKGSGGGVDAQWAGRAGKTYGTYGATF